MIDVISRELTYLNYYLSVQVNFIAPYWALGIIIGSLISVFGKDRLSAMFLGLQNSKAGTLGIIPASLIGILSPLCLYGTIPIVKSFSEKGMREDWLTAFMISSILLNPQLLMFSAALGYKVFILRLSFCLLAGIGAGLLVRRFFRSAAILSSQETKKRSSRDTHPNVFIRLLKNIGRNLRATAPYFLAGIVLTALFQRYVPEDFIAGLFSKQKGMGIFISASLGVPLYICGGGTIPILSDLLNKGMSSGAAVAFMLTGPATKFTNMSALKMILSNNLFFIYLAFIFAFAICSGIVVNLAFH